MTSQKATLIGLVAIVLWSTMVGLIRGVSEGLGPVGGAAMIYSLSGLLLIFTVGLPDIRRFPGRYLIAGSNTHASAVKRLRKWTPPAS